MTIIYVPKTYPTITEAISASFPHDTIIVDAGVYNEQVFILVENLTLLGAQANVDARLRTFVAENESIITFAAPVFGTGIVNPLMPGIIFNGFTVQGNIVDSTAGIFSGDIGVFSPGTETVDVTGLQILNNIIQDNGSGILIASIEQNPLAINYLVQHNYFYNNSGSPGGNNGHGVYFHNGLKNTMSNVLVTENLFNGLETNSSVTLENVLTSTISYNVMNNDNSIRLSETDDIKIIGNKTSNAAGVADAIIINFATNTIIENNLIFAATANGISIISKNSGVTITGNCIENNAFAGIAIQQGSDINSSITINNNNIEGNSPGLLVSPNSYTQTKNSLHATSNYWNSPSGPNYNSTGPGTGDAITDLNINSGAVQTVVYSPFLINELICPQSPLAPTQIVKYHDVRRSSVIFQIYK